MTPLITFVTLVKMSVKTLVSLIFMQWLHLVWLKWGCATLSPVLLAHFQRQAWLYKYCQRQGHTVQLASYMWVECVNMCENIFSTSEALKAMYILGCPGCYLLVYKITTTFKYCITDFILATYLCEIHRIYSTCYLFPLFSSELSLGGYRCPQPGS